MDCARAQAHIECYADGELDAVTSTRVEEHVSHCDACRRALDGLGALRSLVKEAAPYYSAPEDLSRRIRKRVHATAPTARAPERDPWWRWLRPAALIATTAVVTWIAASQFYEPQQDDGLAETMIAGHARATLTGHVTDVASSERHTVKPWLSSKLDFSPPVPDLSAAGFPLAGGRMDYAEGRPVAVLVYHRRQHVIDVFVWPESDTLRTPPSQALSKKGYQVFHWTAGGMTYWAVSDLNAPEMKTFAETFSSSI